ncbi:TetR/AcrR family transcriptional regulator [Rummeliibacillus stabekisii]|uniref:TetR family transcriptional regulator n=1 Tax=Rummeliibacillus stabekisii TaxID=241244 RepID=A0A143HEX3_9BACL|nr:TetR/AcrR family transcriptional regulator [Rummeliibacillus stabekisii]AMX00027.1 TetR family transcriptional regulator [Rummeliibacillus stabekisii]
MENERHMTSLRQNRTKNHFKHALIELIKEEGYHAVTVKDIVDYAEYNRSTFYIYYQDKIELAEELLVSMMQGLEASVGKSYIPGYKVYTTKLNAPSFNIVSYIYKNRHFFELINFDDTLPGLHTRFPQTILKIYQEQFTFETINNMPVNMDYFKRYTAYGFYGLIQSWIQNGFKETHEEFIEEVIKLTRTHIYTVKYNGWD